MHLWASCSTQSNDSCNLYTTLSRKRSFTGSLQCYRLVDCYTYDLRQQCAAAGANLAVGLLQVEEWSMYGILSSKVNHTFVKRPSDPKSGHVDFTAVFDSEKQLEPSVRLMYLYMLYLAGHADRLDPQKRFAAADTDNSVPIKRKRARTSVSGQSASTDDHDADDSDVTTDAATDGPAQHTRSKGAKVVPKANKAASCSGTNQPQHLKKQMTQSAKTLCQIPQVARSRLFLGRTISFGQDCVVSLPCYAH